MKSILLLGEAMGQNEARLGVPFIGPSGIELLKLLDEAEIITLTAEDRGYLNKYYNTGDGTNIDMIWRMHPEVHRTNVFNLHPHGDRLENLCGGKEMAINGWPKLGTIGWIRSEYASELERLGDEILELDPNLIICLGNTALWALGGRTAISKLRGTTFLSTHCVSGFKCLAAYHPAAVIRQWELRPVTIIDLAKAPRENLYPEIRRPSCSIWIEPSITDIERFHHEQIVGCEILATDIETSGTRITCIGFAPRRDVAIVVPFDDDRKPDRNYWPTPEDEFAAWQAIRRILEDPSIRKCFQNGLYDIAFLWRSYGIRVFGAAEDTMLLSHALQPESLKGLAFLGSVFTDHGPWKSERKSVDTTIKRDA